MNSVLHWVWVGVEVIFALIWGCFFALLGILFCLSIVFIPVGVACFLLCGAPLAGIVRHEVNRYVEYENRERPMPNESEPPWIL